MLKILGLSLYGPLAASTRYRLEQYISGLAEYGIDLQVHHLLGDEYLRCRFQGKRFPLLTLLQASYNRLSLLLHDQHFDAAILYAELFPFLPGWLERYMIRIPYIYDFDDAFYLKYRCGKFGLLRPVLGKKVDQVIAGAAAVTAGNKELLGYAKAINKQSFFCPTVVDLERYQPAKQISSGRPFTVGWIGSPSTSLYLKTIVRPLSTLGREGTVQFIVVGGSAPAIPYVEVIEKEWCDETEIALINSFDVGIMPLHDDEWARGKCAFKLIQYMACEVPVVASRVGANIDVVQSGCGILVSNENEWLEALRKMRDQPRSRQKMGNAGRKHIKKYYSLKQNISQLTEIFYGVVQHL
ncbi:MAG: glycosyltransferase [Candidatus Electrothrix sp. MAN1_4]|nr:glycosyltransferase [Candidatus Electrothrix sp. MAN1_4]